MALLEIKSDIADSIWKLVKDPGEAVPQDESIMLLESMNKQIQVVTDADDTVKELSVKDGEPIPEGHVVASIET